MDRIATISEAAATEYSGWRHMLGSVGVDSVDVKAATARGIPVTNIPDTFIEEVADTCILYKIAEPSAPALAQATIVVQQAEQIVRALEKLKGFKGVGPHWIEIHRLENEGDRVARQAIADLFTNGTDPVETIKWKDVYALLEDTIDSCEDVANVIERIVVKHA